MLIVKFIGDDEILGYVIPVMCVYYHLTIYDGKYPQWQEVFSSLMRNDCYGSKWCWKYFVVDVIKADIRNSNFENLYNKNECILQGIRQMIRVVGQEQLVLIRDVPNSTSFVQHVMNWLYGVNANNDAKVAQEVTYNVDRINNVSARFELMNQMYRYYCFESTRAVPDDVRLMFKKYLPFVNY